MVVLFVADEAYLTLESTVSGFSGQGSAGRAGTVQQAELAMLAASLSVYLQIFLWEITTQRPSWTQPSLKISDPSP